MLSVKCQVEDMLYELQFTKETVINVGRISIFTLGLGMEIQSEVLYPMAEKNPLILKFYDFLSSPTIPLPPKSVVQVCFLDGSPFVIIFREF